MVEISSAERDRLNAALAKDPDIQRVLQAERAKLASTRDQGGQARDYQNGIRDLVTHIAQEKGLLPKGKYFINPNDGQVEPARGWAGLNNWQKALAIGGVAAATVATAGAFGAGPAAGLFAGGGGGGTATTAGTGALTATTVNAAGIPVNMAVGSGLVAPTATTATSGLLGSQALRYGLQYGVPVAGNLIAGKMQSNALSEASRLEQDYLNRALEAEKEDRDYKRKIEEENRIYDRAKYTDETNYGRRNYGNFVETLEPYRAAGTTATEFMAQLLGQSVTPYSGNSYYDVARDARTPTTVGAPGQAPPGQAPPPQGQTVRLRAPTGEEQDIPVAQAAYHLGRGAVRV